MNVILLEPSFPDNQKQFARALAEAGATVIGIGERPKEGLDDDVRGWLSHYEQVDSVVNDRSVEEAVRWVQDKIWVDRLEATVEAHVMTAPECAKRAASRAPRCARPTCAATSRR